MVMGTPGTGAAVGTTPCMASAGWTIGSGGGCASIIVLSSVIVLSSSSSSSPPKRDIFIYIYLSLYFVIHSSMWALGHDSMAINSYEPQILGILTANIVTLHLSNFISQIMKNHQLGTIDLQTENYKDCTCDAILCHSREV